MNSSLVDRLREHGVQPTAQRVAVAEYVLVTDEHPSAEHVYARVRERFPLLSRATVYNTLNLLVEKRLLRQLTLAEGRVVFDPNLERHHHFIDDATGAIHDVPWPALRVTRIEELPDFDVREYQVVMRGKRRARQKARK
jgi:Fe2+ or Zn2+ uptake regulation protein